MIDLKQYPTNFLRGLIPLINNELKSRRKAQGVSKRIAFIETLNPQDNDFTEERTRIIEFNSSQLLSLPNLSQPCHIRSRYLSCLLAQDWSELFPDNGNSKNEYYVYVHTDPSDKVFVTDSASGGNYGGTPFYVGKGIGARAYDLKRNQGHGKKIKDVLSKGYDKESIVKIVFLGLSESKALEIESKLIYFFGSIYEKPNGASLYNLDIPSRPKFKDCMVKIPAKSRYINKENQDEILNGED